MADKTKPNVIKWRRPTDDLTTVVTGMTDVLFDLEFKRTHGPFNPNHVPLRLRNIMRKDPQVALGMWTIKAPIIGAQYTVEGPNADINSYVANIEPILKSETDTRSEIISLTPRLYMSFISSN